MGEIANQIVAEVGGWPGVKSGPHRFGGVEFRVAGHEIGHLHGDRLADLPFPVAVRRELVESGRALPHHVLPDTGWVSFRLGGMEDVHAAIGLFRLNYDRITAAAAEGSEPESAAAEEPEVHGGEESDLGVIDVNHRDGTAESTMHVFDEAEAGAREREPA